MSFDPNQFKSQFPLFSQPENSALIYLDNAATTQRPQVVIDAIARFYTTGNANTHRSSHRLARQATEMVERTRGKASQFLNARLPEEIVFCRGATEALNLLAYSLTLNLKPGDEILLSRAEHHANLVSWQMAAERKGLVLTFLPDKGGVPDLSQLENLVTDRTRILAITAASNALGFKVDLAGIAEQIKDKEICWVVDAAQLAAHETIDVQEIGCDFLVCSAHKFYGPTGIGLLYGKAETLKNLPPWQGGGEMIRSVTLEHSEYAAPPHRFETGTSSLAAIAGLEACLDFWAQQDRPVMLVHEQQLVEYLHQKLSEIPEIKLLSEPQNNVGIATFEAAMPKCFAEADLAHWLDEQDIAVRVGHHCAMPLMNARASSSTLRVSIAAYNHIGEIDALIASIKAFILAVDNGPRNSSETSDDIFMRDDLSDFSVVMLRNQKNWQMRYGQLMKWSSFVNAKPEIRLPEFQVVGCESEAWLAHQVVDGRYQFAVDSDARVVKGLACLLLVLVNNKAADEIQTIKFEQVFSELGLQKYLSVSRVNGLNALLNKILEQVDQSVR